MFSSRLLTWSRRLLPDGSSANGLQVCPWAPGGRHHGGHNPSYPVPTPLVTFSHRTWAGLGQAMVHWCTLTPGGRGIKGQTASFSDWLLISEPPSSLSLLAPWCLQCTGPRGNMKVVLWNKMAAWATSLWGEGLAWCLLVRLSVSVPMGLHDYGPVSAHL